MAGTAWSERSERELVDALRAGDEGAFRWLVSRYGKSMHNVARGLLRSEALAAEVVQEAWAAIIQSIDRFRQEASLKTWMFRILVNRARRVGKREARTIPLSAFESPDEDGGDGETADRFSSLGRWTSPVHGWRLLDPEDRASYRSALDVLGEELARLPERQRVVVTLRDVEGLESSEVCDLLDISEGNQRVLLHRGRTRLRQALERAERAHDTEPAEA